MAASGPPQSPRRDADGDPEEADSGDSAAAPRFPPDEEAALVAESGGLKAAANTLFTTAKYENAITKYEEAVAICPHYLDYELAVLRCNIAACHLKLEQWQEAITSASDSVAGLARVEKAEAAAPHAMPNSTQDAGEQKSETHGDVDNVEEEIISSGAKKSGPALGLESDADAARRRRHEDILRIRAKALMRRARARSELGGWSALSGAEDDYKLLSTMSNLNPADKKIVSAQLRALPPRTKAAQEQEMGEMWGKLKDLGNGLLNPFGLSTDNFKMVKDEKTGGYSMNFSQN